MFFYEDHQEELINKSGPEAFSKMFKEEARVIVILSRDEWSESYYTEIEKNAIIDRTSVKNQGYNFLIIIPMEPGQAPLWYPSTRIYLNPRSFTIEQLASFIEFKVTEEGGIVKLLTLEDIHQNLFNRIEEKKSIIKLQTDPNAIQTALEEVLKVKDIFNQKIQTLNTNSFDRKISHLFTEFSFNAFFGMEGYILECTISKPDEMYNRIVTTQDIVVVFELFKLFEAKKERELIVAEQRLFYYTTELRGWALRYLDGQASKKELPILFNNRDNTKYYNLKDIISSEALVDKWFQKLFLQASNSIEKHL